MEMSFSFSNFLSLLKPSKKPLRSIRIIEAKLMRHLICHINYLLLFIVLFMIKKESYVLDPLYNKCTDLR